VHDASIAPKRLSELLSESARQANRDRIGAPSPALADRPLQSHFEVVRAYFSARSYIASEKDFNMATTLPGSTLRSSDNHLPSRILIGVGVIVGGIALGGILAEGGHYVGERDCQPRVEWCNQADKLRPPDEPAQKDPSDPIGKLRTSTIATSTSTLTPTNAVVVATPSKK
jgi:hypothetical protein